MLRVNTVFSDGELFPIQKQNEKIANETFNFGEQWKKVCGLVISIEFEFTSEG